MKQYVLICVLCLCAVSAFSQDDTSRVFLPSLDDSSAFRDSADTAAVDSLSPVERAARQHEERMQQLRAIKAKAAAKPRLSVFDTLAVYFTSPRLNQRDWLTRSFAFDAGDYFKLDPGYFALKHYLLPIRNTVQPYGLTGDKVNILLNGQAFHPFEHIPEPDGTVDLSDLPTALDDSIYILPGPSGMLFGGNSAVATLLTRTTIPRERRLRSALVLDKGQFGFSHVRGRYSNHLANGRTFDLSVGYRVADDLFSINERSENSYQYQGSVFWPLGARYGLHVSGNVNDRTGRWYQALGGGLLSANRDRFDRNLRASFLMSNDSQTVKSEFGYQHSRQGSNINGFIKTRLDNTEHAVFAGREWLSGGHVVRTEVTGRAIEYANGFRNVTRYTGDASVTFARPYQTYRLATEVGARYVESFRILPRGSVTLIRESKRFMLLTSVGYSEREPGLNDLYFPFTTLRVSSDQVFSTNVGDSTLEPERQLTGTVRAEWGKVESALRLEVTGGRIFKGVEWLRNSAALFKPANTDQSFVNTTLTKRFQLGDYASFLGGGSYHFVHYDLIETRPYQPEYQFFGGLELHYYWRPKLIHVWLYGEWSYVGPYEGYTDPDLGQQAMFNGKFSFSMGNFRFRLLYQNLLGQANENRQGLFLPDNVITWGFNWNFFD